jgi:hypothetical protein
MAGFGSELSPAIYLILFLVGVWLNFELESILPSPVLPQFVA